MKLYLVFSWCLLAMLAFASHMHAQSAAVYHYNKEATVALRIAEDQRLERAYNQMVANRPVTQPSAGNARELKRIADAMERQNQMINDIQFDQWVRQQSAIARAQGKTFTWYRN